MPVAAVAAKMNASLSSSSGVVRQRAKGATSLKAARASSADRLKDEVYRAIFLAESNRPGSEMALALALLRAVVECDGVADQESFRAWLKTVCPLGLKMIESSLNSNRAGV